MVQRPPLGAINAENDAQTPPLRPGAEQPSGLDELFGASGTEKLANRRRPAQTIEGQFPRSPLPRRDENCNARPTTLAGLCRDVSGQTSARPSLPQIEEMTANLGDVQESPRPGYQSPLPPWAETLNAWEARLSA